MDTIDAPILFSETFDKLIEALATAETVFAPVVKDRENPHFGNKYASLDAMQSATRPALAANGLIIAQLIWPTGQVIRLYTRMVHTSGQWMQSSVPLSAWGRGPQVFGSELTYLKRYCYAAMLNISADQDDDDATAAQGGKDTRAVDRPPPRPPTQAQTQRRTIRQWLDDLDAVFRAAPGADGLEAILAREDVRNAERDFVGNAAVELASMLANARAAIEKLRGPDQPKTPPAFEAVLIDSTGTPSGAPITDPVVFAKTLLIGVQDYEPQELAALIEFNADAIEDARQTSGEAAALLKELDEQPLGQTSGQTTQPVVAPVERGKVSWPGYVKALRADLDQQMPAGLVPWLTAQREGLTACPIGQRALAIQAIAARFDKAGETPPIWLAEMMRPTAATNGAAKPDPDERWVGRIIDEVKTIHDREDFNALVRSSEVQATMTRLQKSSPVLFDRANAVFMDKSRLFAGVAA